MCCTQIDEFVHELSFWSRVDDPHAAEPCYFHPMSIIIQPIDESFRPTGDHYTAVMREISQNGIAILSTRQISERYLSVLLKNPHREEMEIVAAVAEVICSEPDEQGVFDVVGRFVATVSQ